MSSTLDRVFDPIFTPAVARRIVRFRADPDVKARIQELADKSNDGLLTDAEREEYEGYVRAIDLVAILQSKARRYLAEARKRR
jgi:hypothetical protein